MKRVTHKLFFVMNCLVVFAAGCASPVDHKSPEELLSLSVAGLSGIDRYTFNGQTGIAAGESVDVKSTAFQGMVQNHNQIQVKSKETEALTGIGNPLELLKQVQATAKQTELVSDQSGKWTSVLAITSDEKAAAKVWKKNLKDQFEQISKKMPAASAKGKAMTVKSRLIQHDLAQEWQEELKRSGAEFNHMLSTLQVKSSYTLVVDRKHLVPLKLAETSVLHYKTSDGEQHTETRKTNMAFQLIRKGST